MSSTASTAASARPRASRLTPRAAFLAVLMTALMLYLAVPLRGYFQQRARLDHIATETRVLEQQNTLLLRQIAKLHDPSYLELLARQCLGMVRPGEISFIVVPKGGQAQPATC